VTQEDTAANLQKHWPGAGGCASHIPLRFSSVVVRSSQDDSDY